jgi:hypothetical protein
MAAQSTERSLRFSLQGRSKGDADRSENRREQLPRTGCFRKHRTGDVNGSPTVALAAPNFTLSAKERHRQ